MNPLPGADPTLFARFMANVSATDGCWLWSAGEDGSGYGRIMLRRSRTRAHRFAWIFFRGPIPAMLCVLHRCDVRRCVNPDHLFLGTKSDNTADMDAKGRRVPAAGERHGSRTHPELLKLDEATVRKIRTLASYGMEQKKIALAYGVSRNLVYKIIARKAWRHVV